MLRFLTRWNCRLTRNTAKPRNLRGNKTVGVFSLLEAEGSLKVAF